MTWENAKSRAAALTVGTFSGWSLPSADPACGSGINCVTCQMGALWYGQLGGVGEFGTQTDGPFKNLVDNHYWLSTEHPVNTIAAWAFGTSGGDQGAIVKFSTLYAVAIRRGDLVDAVPEPETYAMLLAGLGLSGVFVSRRRDTAEWCPRV